MAVAVNLSNPTLVTLFASAKRSILRKMGVGVPRHAHHPQWLRLVQKEDLPLITPYNAVPLLPACKEQRTNPRSVSSAQEWFNQLPDDTAKSIVHMRRAMLHNYSAQALPLARPARPPQAPPDEVLDALSAGFKSQTAHRFHQAGNQLRASLRLPLPPSPSPPSPSALATQHYMQQQQQQQLQAMQAMQVASLAAQQQAALLSSSTGTPLTPAALLPGSGSPGAGAGAGAQGSAAGWVSALFRPKLGGAGAGSPPGVLGLGEGQGAAVWGGAGGPPLGAAAGPARPQYPLGPGQPLPPPGQPLPPPGMSSLPDPVAATGFTAAAGPGPAAQEQDWGKYEGIEPPPQAPWYERMGAFSPMNYKWNKLDNLPDTPSPTTAAASQAAGPGQGQGQGQGPQGQGDLVPRHLLQPPVGLGAPQPGVMPGQLQPFLGAAQPSYAIPMPGGHFALQQQQQQGLVQHITQQQQGAYPGQQQQGGRYPGQQQQGAYPGQQQQQGAYPGQQQQQQGAYPGQQQQQGAYPGQQQQQQGAYPGQQQQQQGAYPGQQQQQGAHPGQQQQQQGAYPGQQQQQGAYPGQQQQGGAYPGQPPPYQRAGTPAARPALSNAVGLGREIAELEDRQASQAASRQRKDMHNGDDSIGRLPRSGDTTPRGAAPLPRKPEPVSDRGAGSGGFGSPQKSSGFGLEAEAGDNNRRSQASGSRVPVAPSSDDDEVEEEEGFGLQAGPTPRKAIPSRLASPRARSPSPSNRQPLPPATRPPSNPASASPHSKSAAPASFGLEAEGGEQQVALSSRPPSRAATTARGGWEGEVRSSQAGHSSREAQGLERQAAVKSVARDGFGLASEVQPVDPGLPARSPMLKGSAASMAQPKPAAVTKPSAFGLGAELYGTMMSGQTKGK
ncbi:hypothetical protein QJQ45_016243 [Haematococcus lacustris]|nr:hypothetical protein QJQ45_016243 [Haematococcus lacustris]